MDNTLTMLDKICEHGVDTMFLPLVTTIKGDFFSVMDEICLGGSVIALESLLDCG